MAAPVRFFSIYSRTRSSASHIFSDPSGSHAAFAAPHTHAALHHHPRASIFPQRMTVGRFLPLRLAARRMTPPLTFSRSLRVAVSTGATAAALATHFFGK